MAENILSKIEDLTDRQFGRLTVVEFAGQRSGLSVWTCVCSCGNSTIVYASNLKQGKTKSCGCGRDECLKTIGQNSVTHGLTNSKEYASWCSAKARCFNPSNKKYRHYGARGITMCEEWRNDFSSFYRDMGPRPNGTTLDRIDNDSNYEPKNCRWATSTQQMRNRQGALKVTHDGQTLPLKEWSERTGIRYETLVYRLKNGFPLFAPLGPTSRRYK